MPRGFPVQGLSERASKLFPSVLLTVLSIVQALALELLWSRVHEASFLWAGGWPALLGWVQVAVMLLGFAQVWLFYVSIVLRFRWPPTIADALIPFGIGILEFALIDLMGPGWLGPWFYTLAMVFAASMRASYSIFRRARLDPANRAFFSSVVPAQLRDFAPGIAASIGLVLLGVLLHTSGATRWLALLAVLAAGAALAHQLVVLQRFWRDSILLPTPPEDSH